MPTKFSPVFLFYVLLVFIKCQSNPIVDPFGEDPPECPTMGGWYCSPISGNLFHCANDSVTVEIRCNTGECDNGSCLDGECSLGTICESHSCCAGSVQTICINSRVMEKIECPYGCDETLTNECYTTCALGRTCIQGDLHPQYNGSVCCNPYNIGICENNKMLKTVKCETGAMCQGQYCYSSGSYCSLGGYCYVTGSTGNGEVDSGCCEDKYFTCEGGVITNTSICEYGCSEIDMKCLDVCDFGAKCEQGTYTCCSGDLYRCIEGHLQIEYNCTYGCNDVVGECFRSASLEIYDSEIHECLVGLKCPVVSNDDGLTEHVDFCCDDRNIMTCNVESAFLEITHYCPYGCDNGSCRLECSYDAICTETDNWFCCDGVMALCGPESTVDYLHFQNSLSGDFVIDICDNSSFIDDSTSNENGCQVGKDCDFENKYFCCDSGVENEDSKNSKALCYLGKIMYVLENDKTCASHHDPMEDSEWEYETDDSDDDDDKKKKKPHKLIDSLSSVFGGNTYLAYTVLFVCAFVGVSIGFILSVLVFSVKCALVLRERRRKSNRVQQHTRRRRSMEEIEMEFAERAVRKKERTEMESGEESEKLIQNTTGDEKTDDTTTTDVDTETASI